MHDLMQLRYAEGVTALSPGLNAQRSTLGLQAREFKLYAEGVTSRGWNAGVI
jgi:hypothetical protein